MAHAVDNLDIPSGFSENGGGQRLPEPAMRGRFVRAVVILLAMIMSSALAVALRPTIRVAESRPKVDLVQLIPKDFGDWKIDTTIAPISVSPDVQAKLDVLYNQTMSRTYVNGTGERVMLSIAYGSDQSGEGTQVHRPEFCYTAQGFQVTRNVVGTLITAYGVLPVRRLIAVQGGRNEPITYWITVGERATLPGIGRKISQLAYGLTGKVPDGMLVRVSSIDTEDQRAYQLQETFVKSLLAAMDPQGRVTIAGRFG